MIVAKFGGTSVATAEAIRRLVGIVADRARRAGVVVVSALAGVTDGLVVDRRCGRGAAGWPEAREARAIGSGSGIASGRGPAASTPTWRRTSSRPRGA